MGNWTRLAVLATVIVLASSCTSGTGSETGGGQAAGTRASSPLLMPAGGGDGDSWHDTTGHEYRLGLVNTPEYNECYGSEATAKRKELTAHGFRADVYTHDVYGRGVSIVTTANGINVNIYLARHGFANDRYLAQFRHENPKLAAQLDAAFATARAERAGLWSACSDTHGAAAPLAPATVAPK
jgi:endonuclease YncB( thermonuclease family)